MLLQHLLMSGSPLCYEVFVAQCSHVIQQSIGQAVGDLRLMNPSLMNPVSEASSLSKPQDPFDHRKHFGFRSCSRPLPYLLSWCAP